MHRRFVNGKVSFLVLLGVIAAVFALAACGADPTSTPQPIDAPAPTATSMAPGETMAPPTDAPPAPTPEGGQAFADLVAAAKAEVEDEKTVVIRGGGYKESTLRRLEVDFRNEFDIDMRLEDDPKTFQEVPTVYIAECEAGQKNLPILWYNSAGTASPVFDKGCGRDDVDWKGLFSEKWPLIGEMVDLQPYPALRDGALIYLSRMNIIAYNTEFVDPADAPTSIEELADPKYNGRVGTHGIGFMPSYLQAVWSQEQAIDYATRLKANNPIFGSGSPGLANMVASGEVWVTVINHSFADRAIATGAPVEWNIPSDGLVIYHDNLNLPKGASHPNLSVLLTAYIAMEGVGGPIGEGEGWSRVMPSDARGTLGAKLEAAGLDPTKMVDGGTIENATAERAFRSTIADIYKS
jgi:ABC-type Fe3+ transport system substrate-binding protein